MVIALQHVSRGNRSRSLHLVLRRSSVHARLPQTLSAAAVMCALAAGGAAAQAPSPPQVSVGALTYLQYVYQLKDTANHLNNFEVTPRNGEDFKSSAGDQRKDVMGRGSVRVLDTDDSSRVGGLRLTAYGQYGKPTSGGKRYRWVGMVSYRSKQVTLAGEYASTKDTVTATPLAETNGRVISGFGVYHVPRSRVAVLARVDVVDPNTNVADDRQTRVIGGVSYQLSPNLRLLADWDYVDYQGTPTAAQEATRSQALFQTQFSF